MKRNPLEITKKREFISPKVKAISCRTRARFLIGSLNATLEDIDEINDLSDYKDY